MTLTGRTTMLSLVRAPTASDRDLAVTSVVRLHERLASRGNPIPVRLWDGTRLGPDADYVLVLRRPWTLRAMLVPPSDLAIGEAYLADHVDVEGSMVAALRALRRLVASLTLRDKAVLAAKLRRLPRPPGPPQPTDGDPPQPTSGSPLRPGGGGVRLRGRRHSKARDALAVRHHYDQDARFFASFLDAELVYSCAYFTEDDRARPVTDRDVLACAQWRKLELICRKLDLRGGERFLDVGCGWGSLVLHAARHHGVEAVGITLSPRQAEVARRRIADAGLQGRARVEVVDYRDVDGPFDAIASIGMVEHVGASHLATYAAALRDVLAEGGRLLNHGITTGQRDVVRDFTRDRSSFVARYVFPDGALVPAYHMVRVIEQAGFEVWDVEQLRPHYARTLEHWVANLEAAADEARGVAGERAYRVWRAYMAGSVLGFASGDLGVVQVLATRGATDLPFGRDRMQLPPAG